MCSANSTTSPHSPTTGSRWSNDRGAAAPDDGMHPNEADLARVRRIRRRSSLPPRDRTAALEWWRDTAAMALLHGDESRPVDAARSPGASIRCRHSPSTEPLRRLVQPRRRSPVDDGTRVTVGEHALVTVEVDPRDAGHPHRLDARQPVPHRVTLTELPTLAAALDSRPGTPDVDDRPVPRGRPALRPHHARRIPRASSRGPRVATRRRRRIPTTIRRVRRVAAGVRLSRHESRLPLSTTGVSLAARSLTGVPRGSGARHGGASSRGRASTAARRYRSPPALLPPDHRRATRPSGSSSACRGGQPRRVRRRSTRHRRGGATHRGIARRGRHAVRHRGVRAAADDTVATIAKRCRALRRQRGVYQSRFAGVVRRTMRATTSSAGATRSACGSGRPQRFPRRSGGRSRSSTRCGARRTSWSMPSSRPGA